ncbi:TonB-dependent receptor [Cellvibrio sp. NN19]|uniref:TonB-dependent receptor plug domain-containing protein n=1 Tax=Cellvibrio chitinivorans TaxID=3102792 RepID=UPI002B406757|nr:TonB-dependent receptor [Cellvibrio sp. NN19]
MKTPFLPAFRVLALCLVTLSVNDVFAQSGDDPELAALMDLLNEETDLATQTKMNADFVPGMVSVLHSDQLKSQGYATVAEALNQVPGFYTTLENAGDVRAIVRGAGASLEASNLKILVDGVAINRPVNASADWALRLPLSQVERIEVIRGPGSALYGEFAFSGVVNIISRRDTAVALRTASHNHRQLDAMVSHEFDNGVSMQINASAWDRDNSGLQTNPDNFAQSGKGYSPGDVQDAVQGQLLLADLSYNGYRLQVQHADMERGAWYGQNAAMPRALAPRVEKITSVELSKNWQLQQDLSLGMALGQLETKVDEATYLPIPKGIDPPGPAPVLINEFYRQDGTSDSNQHIRLNLRWTGLTNHNVFMEAGYSQSQLDSAYKRMTLIEAPVNGATPSLVQAKDLGERGLTSLTLQDQWQIHPAVEITLGARYDDYDDWGNHTSPRLAAVWRASDRHIFKVQYAEAFRPPTLGVLNPGPSAAEGTVYERLTQEQLDSTEASYIYRAVNYSLRATLFESQVSDLIEYRITPGQRPKWHNLGEIDSQGVELEWQQTLGRNWNWFANISYVDAQDPLDVDQKLLGSVDWLGNLGVTWNSDQQLSHAFNLRYVGEQEGWELQTRTPPTDRFDDYVLLDYTLSVHRLFAQRDLELKAGVKNLADQHYNTVPTPSQYPRGLPNGERTWWAELEYGF